MSKSCWNYAGFDVLTATMVKIKLFWDVTPRCLVNSYLHFGRAYRLPLQGVCMDFMLNLVSWEKHLNFFFFFSLLLPILTLKSCSYSYFFNYFITIFCVWMNTCLVITINLRWRNLKGRCVLCITHWITITCY